MIQAMLRLFIGLLLPGDVRAHVRAFCDPLRSNPGLRFIPEKSTHITLKFLGDVDSKNVSKIQSVLGSVAPAHESFSLALENGGVFPSKRAPKIFWTGVGGDVAALESLASDVEEKISPLGFPREKRKFIPHVTLAKADGERVRPVILSGQFCTLFSHYTSPLFAVNEVHLIQSHLNAGGSTYETLGSFPLR
jgi:2'-5' RNA ligase